VTEDNDSRIGLLLGSTTPPEQIAGLAREAERAGFGELWIPEDYFFLGGMAASAIALSATERIGVGTAVVSCVVRHPALLAMEIATLARAYPNRFRAGIGHGVPAWTAQMSLSVPSPMSALRETLVGVRSLLAGQRVTGAGRVHSFTEVALTHPPAAGVPLFAGVLGDKGIALAGELADGMVVSVLATPEYVAATREKLDKAAASAGRDTRPELVVLVALNITRDASAAEVTREQVRPVLAFYLAAVGPNPLLEPIGANQPLADMLARGGPEVVLAEMPERWVDAVSVTGASADAPARIRRFFDAGADRVVVVPLVPDGAAETLAASGELLAALPSVN
jgi:alkanesulfonate monooxygenase SsuD/methylene tetrahydromethanopterin reductase-like flavin-dependent oxidoreductase (luciferase family)